VPISERAVTHENQVTLIRGPLRKLSWYAGQKFGKRCAYVNTSALPIPEMTAASGARVCPRNAIAMATTTMTPCTMPPTMTNIGEADIPLRR